MRVLVVSCCVLLSAGIVLLTACGDSSSTGAADSGPRWTVGMSQCNLGEPWRVQMNADVKAAAEKHPQDLKVIFKDAQNDTLK